MTLGSLFDGISGFPLAASRCGITTKWISEINPYCLKLSKKNFPDAIQYGDIRELHNPESVDIISGGFPCTDISISGKGNGIESGQSSLWFEMYRIVKEKRPAYVVIENSPMLLQRGFEKILHAFSKIGYNAEWRCLQANWFGHCHRRERLFIVAYPDIQGWQGILYNNAFAGIEKKGTPNELGTRSDHFLRFQKRFNEPPVFRVDDGIPQGLDIVEQLGAIGNSIVTDIAELIFKSILLYKQTA